MENYSKGLVSGLKAAQTNSTKFGMKSGGWIRLARMASLSKDDGTSYIVAVRATKDGEAAEVGCSCPDWIYRKRTTKEMCKHQTKFLGHVGGTALSSGVWLYNAGSAFLLDQRTGK